MIIKHKNNIIANYLIIITKKTINIKKKMENNNSRYFKTMKLDHLNKI